MRDLLVRTAGGVSVCCGMGKRRGTYVRVQDFWPVAFDLSEDGYLAPISCSSKAQGIWPGTYNPHHRIPCLRLLR